MAVFSKFFGDFISETIRENAGKNIKMIFELFIKQKTLFNFVSFLTEQTLGCKFFQLFCILKIASKKMMTVKFVKKGLDQNLAWQIISIHFMKKRNFLSHIELKLHLHHFRYFSGSTNHVSFILFTFFLKRVSFSVVFQIQWLERISLF